MILTQAEAEMRIMGYSMLDDHDDVLGYLAKYQPQRRPETVPITPVKRQK